MRVLFLTPRRPDNDHSGGLQVTLERLNGLASVADVTVAHIADVNAGPEARGSGAPRVHCAMVSAGRLRSRSALSLARSLVAGLPLSVWRNSHPLFLATVTDLRREPWDLVYSDHWLVWEAARSFAGAPKILHLHNAEPELVRRAALVMSGVRRAVAMLEYERTRAYLRTAARDADELHVLSADDADALAASGIRHRTTRAFLPAVAAPSNFVPRFGSRDAAVLFVGSLSWIPNHEGLAWFLRHGWPRCSLATAFHVVGAGAPPDVVALARACPRTIVHGFVEDLEPHYSRTRCLVAPLLSGSGIKIKIVNALARGLPVVTTSVGCEGFPERGGGGVVVADDPRAFSDAVDALVSDEDRWTTASTAARQYASAHFSGAAFREWCEGLARRAAAAARIM
jgi:glycosyltransferase involved in cell wall biosynthesis